MFFAYGIEISALNRSALVPGNRKCWRSSGLGGDYSSRFEIFFCAENATHTNVGGPLTHRGDTRIGLFADGIRYPNAGWFYVPQEHNLTIVESIVRTPGYSSHGSCPNNCLMPGCEFVIFDGSKEIFNKKEETCPEWQIKKQSCPPETCECRHGNRICCFSPDGRIVKTFLV